MRRKTILVLAAVWEIPDRIVKLTLTLLKEIYSPLMMLVLFGGMFATATAAQSSLQTKIFATAAQTTTDEATQKRIEELIAQLGNEDGFTRGSAVNSLVRIGKSAVQPRVKALGDKNERVRRSAAAALGKIGDPQAVQPLIKALGDENERVQSSAANALGQIGDSQAVQPLIKALGDSNSDVRSSAATALGEIGDQRAVQPLKNLLKDKNEPIRRLAAKALKQIKSKVTELRAQAKAEPPETESQQVKEIPSLPETSVDYYNRGKAYASKGQYDQAISDFNKAIEIDPGFATAYNNRGIAYFYKREYDKAWEDVRKAQGLGYQVHPGFLNDIRKASGRQR